MVVLNGNLHLLREHLLHPRSLPHHVRLERVFVLEERRRQRHLAHAQLLRGSLLLLLLLQLLLSCLLQLGGS